MAKYNRAVSLLASNESDAAILLLRELLQQYPEIPQVALTLARCHHRLGQFDACHAIVEQFLEYETDGPLAAVFRARMHLDRKEPEAVLEVLQSAMFAHPHVINLHLLAGEAHLAMRDIESAQSAFQQALELDPESPGAALGLARTFYEQADYRSAAEQATRSLVLNYINPSAHHLLGKSLAAVGATDHAIGAFEVALKQDSRLSVSHEWLAALHGKGKGDPVRAAWHRRRAHELKTR